MDFNFDNSISPASPSSSSTISDDSYLSSSNSNSARSSISTSFSNNNEEEIDLKEVFAEWVTGLGIDEFESIEEEESQDEVVASRIKREEEEISMEFFNFDLLEDDESMNTYVSC